MKIEYHSSEDQPAVSAAQVEMRRAKPHPIRILPRLALLVILGGVGYALYSYVVDENVYTYGIVAGANESWRAPYRGRVTALPVYRGQHVSKGDKLFTLTPEESTAELAARTALRDALGKAETARNAAFATAVLPAQREVERLQALQDEETKQRENAAAKARVEVEKQTKTLATKRDRAERMTKLQAMGAALHSDVSAAEADAETARLTLEQAKIDLDLAQSRATPGKAALEKAQAELEQAKAQNAGYDLQVEQARANLDFASRDKDPLEVTAPYDGIVLDTGAPEGAAVEEGDTIVSMASDDTGIVDAYLPPEYASSIQQGGTVSVYVPGVKKPLKGIFITDAGYAVKIPEALQEDMRSYTTAVYARVQVDESHRFLVPGNEVRVVAPRR